jgi:hypothetical protein
MPADVLGFRIIEALTGGAGPFARKEGDVSNGGPDEPQPYFEADQPQEGEEGSAQPQLDEAGVAARERVEKEHEALTGKTSGGKHEDDYDEMTVAELKDAANERGVEVSSDARKADLVKALRKADKGE